jgi:hypothetical protein
MFNWESCCQAIRLELPTTESVLGALKAHNLDAFLLPPDHSPRVPARAGHPIVTVPMGFYPSNTSVVESRRGLVTAGPNNPLVISLFLQLSFYRLLAPAVQFTVFRQQLELAFASWALSGLKNFLLALPMHSSSVPTIVGK